jgi:hypothetical protein
MQIDESDEQYRNANDSICKSVEPVSNVTLESPLHSLKQRSQRISTDDGMQIDESDEEHENANDSIRESLESASNVTFQSALHAWKQVAQSTSTDDGT